MKRLGKIINEAMWIGLIVLGMVLCINLLIKQWHGTTTDEPDMIVAPEVGSYDAAIDGVVVDSSFHALLDWYHEQGVWSNSSMIARDKLETANALDIPIDSVTYTMMLNLVKY